MFLKVVTNFHFCVRHVARTLSTWLSLKFSFFLFLDYQYSIEWYHKCTIFVVHVWVNIIDIDSSNYFFNYSFVSSDPNSWPNTTRKKCDKKQFIFIGSSKIKSENMTPALLTDLIHYNRHFTYDKICFFDNK